MAYSVGWNISTRLESNGDGIDVVLNLRTGQTGFSGQFRHSDRPTPPLFDNAASVSPVTAFPIGDRTDDPVRMYLVDVYTLPVNMAGLPAMSVPCGFVSSNTSPGLPVGLQLIGPHLSEPNLLNIAHTYQQATDWHRERPEI